MSLFLTSLYRRSLRGFSVHLFFTLEVFYVLYRYRRCETFPPSCRYGYFGNVIVKPFNFKNSSDGFTKFLSVVESNAIEKNNCTIGLESTGHYWYPLYFFLIENGFDVKVFNPIQTAAFREITIRKVKNDNLDSLLIADFTRFGRYSETYIPDENMLALKNLTRFRLSISDICGSLKKKVIAILDQVFPEYTNVFRTFSVKPASNCSNNFLHPTNLWIFPPLN